jgi:hypothetical protein
VFALVSTCGGSGAAVPFTGHGRGVRSIQLGPAIAGPTINGRETVSIVAILVVIILVLLVIYLFQRVR